MRERTKKSGRASENQREKPEREPERERERARESSREGQRLLESQRKRRRCAAGKLYCSIRVIQLSKKFSDSHGEKDEDDLGVPSFSKSVVFLNIVQKGGGIKTMFKNFGANFV